MAARTIMLSIKLLTLMRYGTVVFLNVSFVFLIVSELHPDLQPNLAEFRQHLVDSMADMAPLKVWQLQG